MDQNLSLYKIFYTVAKTNNISHAANELYISQPAISKAISKLETNLNVKLFIRSSRGVHLTEEGALLFTHTQSAFDSIELAEENIKRIHTLGIGHLRIGVSTTLCKYLLLPYLESFIKANPHIKITIDCQSTFHTLKLLEEGKIDIGLIGKPPTLKDLDFFTIRQIEDGFVTTKTYLDNLKLRGLEDDTTEHILGNANLMLLDEENITRLFIDDYLKSNAIQVSQVLEISNMDLLIEFARIGLGIACVIKDFVQEDLNNQSLVELPLKIGLTKREVGFAYSKKIAPSDSMNKFIAFYKTTN